MQRSLFFTSKIKEREKDHISNFQKLCKKINTNCCLERNKINQPVSVNWPPTMGLYQIPEDTSEGKDLPSGLLDFK